jgi:hypothetical protein
VERQDEAIERIMALLSRWRTTDELPAGHAGGGPGRAGRRTVLDTLRRRPEDASLLVRQAVE